MSVSTYKDWFVFDKFLKSRDGNDIEIYSFNHSPDDTILSEWAARFRRKYCDETLIDVERDGDELGRTREEYLLNRVFPDKSEALGPATRSGDFAELLVADFLRYIGLYWIPGCRYDLKDNRNSSTKGSDIIGIKLPLKNTKNDELVVAEVKAQFSGNQVKPRLQMAVDHSNKDLIRIPHTLVAYKRRYIHDNKTKAADIIKRFQNPHIAPYNEKYIAAACFTENVFDENDVVLTDCSNHGGKNNLRLLVIHGKDMMNLVHSLYERAAHEA